MRMSKSLRDVEVEIVPDRPSSSEVSLTVAYFMLIEDRFVNITLYIVILENLAPAQYSDRSPLTSTRRT